MMRPSGQVYCTWGWYQGYWSEFGNLWVVCIHAWFHIAQTNTLTMLFMRTGERNVDHCLLVLVTIGSIDTYMIGCTASEVVLRLSRLHYRYFLSFVSSWLSCSNGSFRGNRRLFMRENTFTFIFSETFFKGSDGRRKTAYGMLYFSFNADWKHLTMYMSSHLQTSPTISFREAQYPYLVVLLLIAPALSIALTSLLSLLQNISYSVSPSLIQYVCSLPIPDRWGSLHCFWLLDGDLVIADG